MKSPALRVLRLVVCIAGAWGASSPVQAQVFPASDRVFHVLVGFPAGSGADLLVRYFADKLASVSGQKTVVENKAGVMSVLATEAAARAKPDGYTILANGSPLAQNIYLFRKLPYDTARDLTPITTIAKLPFVLAVDAKSPHASVKSLTEALRS
jgi:tripartite-type tricarboxylate transporter receptor subunit TctC